MSTDFVFPSWRGTERCLTYDPDRGEDCVRFDKGAGEAVAKYNPGNGQAFVVYDMSNKEECNCYKVVDVRFRILVAGCASLLAIAWPMINVIGDFQTAFAKVGYGAYIPGVGYILAAIIGVSIAVWSERDHPLKAVLSSIGIPSMVVSLTSLAAA